MDNISFTVFLLIDTQINNTVIGVHSSADKLREQVRVVFHLDPAFADERALLAADGFAVASVYVTGVARSALSPIWN